MYIPRSNFHSRYVPMPGGMCFAGRLLLVSSFDKQTDMDSLADFGSHRLCR